MATKLSTNMIETLTLISNAGPQMALFLNKSTTAALETRDLIQMGFNQYGDTIYFLTAAGRETLATLTPDAAPIPQPEEGTLADELPVYQDAVAAFDAPAKSDRYEAEVRCVLDDRVLIRSKDFGFDIRIDAGEFLEKFLIVGDRVTFRSNWDWFHNPRAIDVKRFVDLTPPTGPILSPTERQALDTFSEDWCFMGMAKQPVCECAWCKLARLEAENAALKARVNELEARQISGELLDLWREYQEVKLTHETVNSILNTTDLRSEVWYAWKDMMTDISPDHSEISARQSDDTENRNAAEGMFF